MEIKKYSFKPHGDDRGQLIAIEECRDVPFDIKRIYYISYIIFITRVIVNCVQFF